MDSGQGRMLPHALCVFSVWIYLQFVIRQWNQHVHPKHPSSFTEHLFTCPSPVERLLSDLWRYDTAEKVWTWVNGDKFGDRAGMRSRAFCPQVKRILFVSAFMDPPWGFPIVNHFRLDRHAAPPRRLIPNVATNFSMERTFAAFPLTSQWNSRCVSSHLSMKFSLRCLSPMNKRELRFP